jgi:hypothetical protein
MILKKTTVWFCLASFAAMNAAGTTLVGGALLNGDFNLPGTAGDVTYAAEPYWVNLGTAGPGANFLKDTLDLDGTHNVVLPEGPGSVPGLDTGHTISENELFSISFQWRDAWQWNDAVDQVMVRLFVTDDDLITGSQSNLVTVFSGASTLDSTFELFARDVYLADAAAAGKRLFVALDTQDGDNSPIGYARVENFELTAAPFTATTYYVAASGNNSNNGLSPADAWLNVNGLDGETFGPGDRILFNRGDTFVGATTLLGSGAPGLPITVGAYGTGDKPLLTGYWNEQRIFRLTDNEYVEFRDLAMSNFNTNNSSIREREVIKVEPPAGSGEINHLYFRNLDISDVQGYGRSVHEDDHRSYAIWLQTVNDDSNPTRFNDVRCEDCTFANIDGRAFTINDASQSLADWRNSGTPYYPSINCVFQNNYGTNIYRNMAQTSGTDGFLLQHNTMDTTVEGSAYWPYNCANTLVQFNIFKHIYADDADAYACHFDYQCINTVMQYNFGYDVQGGLIEIIKAMWGAGAFQEGAIARYNIGIDVGYRNKPNGAAIFLTGDVVDSQVYNNTVIQLSKPQYKAISFEDGWNGPAGWPANSILHNNIFYAADTASGYNNSSRFNINGNVLSHNLYYGSISPPVQDSNPLTDNPLFADTTKFLTNPDDITPEDLKVLFSSAAIGSGLLIADNGGGDFFGNIVSSASTPTIGAHEYASDNTIDSDGDGMYDPWEITYSLNPADPADAFVHSDSDTLLNLAEFALDGDPTDGNDTGHPQSWSLSGGDMIYVYPRRLGSTLAYWLETSGNLASNWVDSGYSEIGTGTIDAEFESVTNTMPAAGSEGFIRLMIQNGE